MKIHRKHAYNPMDHFLVSILILLSMMLPSGSALGNHAAQIQKVIPISPGSGETIYATNSRPKALPEFSWQAVPGAATYKIEVSTSPDFSPSGTLDAAITPYTWWSPFKARLPDGMLFWRVKVETMQGSATGGPEGDPVEFYKDWTRISAGEMNNPNLLSPEDNALMAFSDPPAFSWTPVLGATYYQIQFSSSETFTTPLAFEDTTINLTYQFKEKIKDGLYWWRVIPWQDGDPDWKGKESTPRRVVINYNTAYTPSLISPPDGASLQFTPTFQWTPVIGAEKYSLEWSSDPNFGSKTSVETFGTSYTTTSPIADSSLPNYWRVRVISNHSNDPVYSPTWRFQKNWSPAVTLLTPTNGYEYAWDPYFSWESVAGASAYRIETDSSPAFSNPTKATTTSPFFVFASAMKNCPNFTPLPHPDRLPVYWRVIPIDAGGNEGEPGATWSFICDQSAGAPVQVYPNVYRNPTVHPSEDNTAPVPVFLWKRVLTGAQQVQAAAYRVQVAASSSFEPAAIRWTFDTENMNAVPTQAGLLPEDGGQADYYWRVRPLTALNGTETGQWSQVWRVRFNSGLLPQPTTTIQPLRPGMESEWVETVPLFEWMPLQNAASYRVQISADSSFTSPIGTYSADYPAYSLPTRLTPGTYYWRVTGVNGTWEMGWSAPVRFLIAAQSRWRAARVLGENNSPVIATDPAGDTGSETAYDLTTLSVSQDRTNWYFGFHTNSGSDARYSIFIDVDQIDGSGGINLPQFGINPYNVTFLPDHRPEYLIFLDKINGTFPIEHTRVYQWAKVNWIGPVTFFDLGAAIKFNSATGYVEFAINGKLIGQSETKNSMAAALVSLSPDGGKAQDSVPSDPNVIPGSSSTEISRFVSISDRVNLVAPPFQAAGDPMTYSTVPAFFWQPLVEVPETDYYTMRLGKDPALISWISTNNSNNPAAFTFSNDIQGDGTYYWQVRPVYKSAVSDNTVLQGGWSQTGKLERKGLPAAGLAVTNRLWTPVLTWTRSEGAYSYDVEIDDEPGFASPVYLSARTTENSYTPDTAAFEHGKTYYARIRINRSESISNVEPNVVAFSFQRPPVTGLHTIPATSEAAPARYNPTFCWNPVPSAFRYSLETSSKEDFPALYQQFVTEENCYTVPEGQPDGAFFWRVRMIDGAGKYGPPPETPERFWKLYPAPTLLSPKTKEDGTIFTWTMVDGADHYIIEIADKPDFSNIRYRATVDANSHQPIIPLIFGDFYWRVKMVDHNNIEGPFSDFIHIEFDKVYLPFVRR